MIIKLDPIDTLFFRDGKPFTMGAETWADGLFPPFPSVIYGTLRSAYFAQNINELAKANRDDDPTKDLKIKGIYYSVGDNIYLPMPKDCVKVKDDKKNEAIKLMPFNNQWISNCPTGYLLKTKDAIEVEGIEGGLFNTNTFKDYQSLMTETFPFVPISDHIIIEPKIGIGRDNSTRTSEESRLYRIGMRRLKDIFIIVDFEGFELPERGIMKVGGEGKAVTYEICSGIRINDPEIKNRKFKLYLSTPAIFENGWLPKGMDENTLEGELKGIKVRLLTAVIGKPLYVGGFDMKNKQPKPMRKAVPAGSVYYFEILESDVSIVQPFHGQPISDRGYDKKQGFGTAYLCSL